MIVLHGFWAHIFVFEQTFREIYFPQLLSRRAGLCSVNDTISGKLPRSLAGGLLQLGIAPNHCGSQMLQR
jgi:hypothetical protein